MKTDNYHRWWSIPQGRGDLAVIVPAQLLKSALRLQPSAQTIPVEHIIEFHFSPFADFFPFTRVISFSGLNLAIPCLDWELFISLLTTARQQASFDSDPYFEIFTTTRMLCLLPDQKDMMLREMIKLREECFKLAEEEVTTKNVFSPQIHHFRKSITSS